METRGEVSVFASLEEILKIGQRLHVERMAAERCSTQGMPLLDGDQALLVAAKTGLITDREGALTMSAPDDATKDLVFTNYGELYRRFGFLPGPVKLLIVTGIRQAMRLEACASVVINLPWSESTSRKVRVRCSEHSPYVAHVNEAMISGPLYFSLEGTA